MKGATSDLDHHSTDTSVHQHPARHRPRVVPLAPRLTVSSLTTAFIGRASCMRIRVALCCMVNTYGFQGRSASRDVPQQWTSRG